MLDLLYTHPDIIVTHMQDMPIQQDLRGVKMCIRDRFKGGGLTDEEVRSYYLRAKAFLFPGEEDFGITPVEAQSAGTPVLALSLIHI